MSSGTESFISSPIGIILQWGTLLGRENQFCEHENLIIYKLIYLSTGRGVEDCVTGSDSLSDGVYMLRVLFIVMKSGGLGNWGGSLLFFFFLLHDRHLIMRIKIMRNTMIPINMATRIKWSNGKNVESACTTSGFEESSPPRDDEKISTSTKPLKKK